MRNVKDAPINGPIIDELGLNPENASERGLRLLFVLSFVFPSHFMYRYLYYSTLYWAESRRNILCRDVLKELLSMLGNQEDSVAPLVLSILTFIGKHKPINESFPDLQVGLVICPSPEQKPKT